MPSIGQTLPSELLCEIFSLIPKTTILDLRHLLFVCWSWHHAFISHSKLWNNIIIDGPFYSHFVTRPVEISFIRACLKNSGSRPLYLTINFQEVFYKVFYERLGRSYATHNSFSKRMLPLLQALHGDNGDASARYQSVDILCSTPCTSDSVYASTLLPRLTQLRRLIIRDCLHRTKGLPLPTLIHMQALQLHDYVGRGRTAALMTQDLSKVETLSLKHEASWDDEDLALISAMPELQILKLYSGSTTLTLQPASFYGQLPATVTILAKVHTITLHGMIPPVLLSSLEFPSLQRINVDEAGLLLLSQAESMSVVRTVTHLHLYLSILHDGNKDWVAHLDQVLNRAPNVRSISISGRQVNNDSLAVYQKQGIEISFFDELDSQIVS